MSACFVVDGVGYVELTKGLHAIVDESEIGWASRYAWQALVIPPGRVYAVRREVRDGVPHFIYMHREIFGASGKAIIDHIDQNTLNNCRCNLRSVTKAQNGQNRGKQKNNKSGYKGVSWNRQKKRWSATIVFKQKQIRLGFFENPKDAARAYNAKARELGFLYVPPDPD